MDHKIVWSKQAEKDFSLIINYLYNSWSQHVVLNFTQEVDNKVRLILQSPELGRVVKYNKSKRSIIITKHTRMFYKIEIDKITIIALFGNWQNPKRLKTMGVAEPIVIYPGS